MLKAILISIGFLGAFVDTTLADQAHNQYTISRTDFTVTTSDYYLTREIARKVDKYVKDITKKWLDGPIPRGMRHTTIHVYITSYNRAYCRIKDHPEIVIYSNRNHLDETLKHELTHALLMIRYPDLPRWTHEGVASSWDGPGNQAVYSRILNWSRRSGTYPKLAEIMQGVRFNGRNATAYTASNSLVKFLLSRRDRYTLFLYATGRVTLERAYGFQNRQDLQSAWIKWLTAPCVAKRPWIPVSACKPWMPVSASRP